jgi:hypothetical protein
MASIKSRKPVTPLHLAQSAAVSLAAMAFPGALHAQQIGVSGPANHAQTSTTLETINVSGDWLGKQREDFCGRPHGRQEK